MRIKKVSQTTSTQAQVVDGYSTSAIDSYSCNYANNNFQNSYNLITDGDAVKTGRQVDGKDEYVKRITCSNLGGSSVEKTYATGINMTNVVITDINVTGVSDAGSTFPFPNNDAANCKISLKNTGSLSIIIYNGYWEGQTAHAEIKYFHTS